METLRIYEIDYSVSPGGINMFEIYNDLDNDYDSPYPLYESKSLEDACNWAYKQGCNFTVYTLAQNELEYANA
jgi:hypothetical protein